MQPATIDTTLDLCTRYPLRLGGPRQCGIRSLPDTSAHDQHWEPNPRPSDLESNALSTGPHAPTLRVVYSINTVTVSHSSFYTYYSGYKVQLTKAFADICQLLQFIRLGDVVGDIVRDGDDGDD